VAPTTIDVTGGCLLLLSCWTTSLLPVASNTNTHLPEQTAIRRVGRNMEHMPQPMIVVKYNPGGKILKIRKNSNLRHKTTANLLHF
jgi:hypothetical protein